MTGARRPSWGHNSMEMALSMGRKFQRCMDGCGAYIIIAPAPNGSWIPLEKVGEVPNPTMPDRTLHVVEIHHDNCTNPRVQGNRDPARSHRIAKNEDEPAVDAEQQEFELHRPTA
jgi:hypothetical protein